MEETNSLNPRKGGGPKGSREEGSLSNGKKVRRGSDFTECLSGPTRNRFRNARATFGGLETGAWLEEWHVTATAVIGLGSSRAAFSGPI